MALVQRDFRHDSDVLIRRIDDRLASLRFASLRTPTFRSASPRAASQADLALAECIADVLRQLVADTAWASAADRARVRAAVHFFVVRRNGRNDRRPARSFKENARVVNEIVRDLGRADLALPVTAAG